MRNSLLLLVQWVQPGPHLHEAHASGSGFSSTDTGCHIHKPYIAQHLPSKWLAFAAAYLFSPATFNKWWHGVLKCPKSSAFEQIKLGSFAVVASVKNATFFCCKQLEQVQLNLYQDWVCFWAGDSCSCLFLIKYYRYKWHTHFFLFNCHGWGDLIYAPIQ